MFNRFNVMFLVIAISAQDTDQLLARLAVDFADFLAMGDTENALRVDNLFVLISSLNRQNFVLLANRNDVMVSFTVNAELDLAINTAKLSCVLLAHGTVSSLVFTVVHCLDDIIQNRNVPHVLDCSRLSADTAPDRKSVV